MGRMLDNWRYASKLSRVIYVAVGLLLALFITLWQWPAPRVSQTTQTGIVISAVQDGVMWIQLPEGKRVRAFTPYPVPKPGDEILMEVETYADGSMHAVIKKRGAD